MWRNRKWYKTLIPGDDGKSLMDEYLYEAVIDGLIIAREDPHRSFTLFENHNRLIQFMNILFDYEKSLHEIVLRDTSFKMYFDIDISRDEEIELFSRERDLFFQTFVNTLSKVYQERYNISLDIERDLIWLNGTRKGKVSYHLIIDNYRLANHREVKALFDEIMNSIDERYRTFFDHGIYIPNKNFRILGAVKYGTNSPLRFMNEWSYGPITVNYKYPCKLEGNNRISLEYQASLITVTHHCVLLAEKCVDIHPEVTPVLFLDDQTTESIYNQLCIWEEIDRKELPYEFTETRGNLIIMNRTRSSMCKMCKHCHESENPYIKVVRKGKCLDVIFDCRRGNRMSIGKLTDRELSDENICSIREISHTVDDFNAKKKSDGRNPLQSKRSNLNFFM